MFYRIFRRPTSGTTDPDEAPYLSKRPVVPVLYPLAGRPCLEGRCHEIRSLLPEWGESLGLCYSYQNLILLVNVMDPAERLAGHGILDHLCHLQYGFLANNKLIQAGLILAAPIAQLF